MDTINCSNCQSELPAESVFCKRCRTQLKCKLCGMPREVNANFCIGCGESFSLVSTDAERAINRIEYSQKGNSKSMTANFTDEVGVYLASAFNSVVTGQSIAPKNPFRSSLQIGSGKSNGSGNIKEPPGNIQDAEYIETNYPEVIAKIFKQNDDGKLGIVDNRLKEKSKFDKIKRLSTLFVYAKKISGDDSPTRQELNNLITQEKLSINNFRKFLNEDAKKYFTLKDNGCFSLLTGGKDYAEEILDQITNPNYKPSQSKAGRKSGRRNSNGPSESVKGNSESKIGKSSNPSALEMCNSLIKDGYFENRRKLNDLVEHCDQKKATKYSSQNMNYALNRLVKNQILDREKNSEAQYEYWKK